MNNSQPRFFTSSYFGNVVRSTFAALPFVCSSLWGALQSRVCLEGDGRDLVWDPAAPVPGHGCSRLQDNSPTQRVFELKQQWVAVGVQLHLLHGLSVRLAAQAARREYHSEYVNPAQIMQLHDVQDEAAEADAEHEVQKDGLLGCSRHKAVGPVRTRVGLTAEQVWNFKSKKVVLPNQEDYLHNGAQHNVDNVDEQHFTWKLGWILTHFSNLSLQLVPLLVLAVLRAPVLVCESRVIRTASFQPRLFLHS